MDAHLRVVNFRCGTQPGIVVQIRGDGLRRSVGASGISRQANLDMLEFANASVAHQLAGAAKLRPGFVGSLLRADLQKPPALEPPAVAEEHNNAAMKYCSTCNIGMEDIYKFCPQCGKPLALQSSAATHNLS